MLWIALPIAGLALAIRLYRVTWGLSDGYFFPDEVLIFTPQMRSVAVLDWNASCPARLLYPTLYTNLGGLTLAIAHAVGLVGPFTQSILVAWARGLSACVGAGTVLLTMLLANGWYGKSVALVAGALLAILPLHVSSSWIAGTDVLLTLLFLCTAAAAHLFATSPNRRSAFLLGLTAGLAYGTKYTGLAVLGMVLWAHGEHAFNRQLVSEGRDAKAVLAMLAVSLLGFCFGSFFGCPQCWLVPGAMVEGWRFHWRVTASASFMNAHLTPSLGWYGNPYLYQLVAGFPFWLGAPAYVAAAVGIGMLAARRNRADRLILAAIASYFLPVGASRVVFGRYMLPLFPLLSITAGVALEGALRSRPASRWACIVAVWFYTALLTISIGWQYNSEQVTGVSDFLRRTASNDVVVGVPPLAPYYGIGPALNRLGACRRKARRGNFGGAFTPRRTEFVDPEAIVCVAIFHFGFLRQAPRPTNARTCGRPAVERPSGRAGYTRVLGSIAPPRLAAEWRTKAAGPTGGRAHRVPPCRQVAE